ncbi:MAG: NlpC/P60 family protein [Beijerinckiaceae bacterium]|nr:NlpC/P60 family protein [Beijerinckiaceae bacterium]
MNLSDARRIPARPDLAAAHLEGLVTASEFVQGRRMRVVEEAVGLRARPGSDCSLDTQALFGERVTVYEIHEGWAWVQLEADSYVGYMPAVALDERLVAPTHRVGVPRTFVYPARTMKAPVNGGLPFGASVEVSALHGDFAELAEGGYVWRAHLQPLDHVADPVSSAELFLRVPYLWGGKSFLGLDCSGLVQIALQSAGVAAPRDTDMQQAELGEELPAEAPLRRGDLVFWKGHVGLMQDAATLLHANGHHMQVVSEPFDEACRRIAAKSYGAVTSRRRIGL